MPDGTLRLMFGSTDGFRQDGLLFVAKATADPCAASSPSSSVGPALPATDASDDFAMPLATVSARSSRWTFYEAWRADTSKPFGVHTTGRGGALFYPEPTRLGAPRHFERKDLIWSADLPHYGHAAWFEGNFVYVYGCENTSGA